MVAILSLLNVIAVIVLSVLYVFSFYNISIVLVGVRNQRKECQRIKQKHGLSEKLPRVSIIVPVKGEELVIARLLEALLRLNYPSDMMEIVIVEDGSADNTAEICKEYVGVYPHRMRMVHQTGSNGKPAALNYGLRHISGEIVAVFDADSVPNRDAVLNAVKHFEDPSVTAVQGRNSSINADQNVLTKVVSFEEAIAFQTYLQGRDALNLFVPLTGSCCFIRKDMIEEVGGWDGESLCEDFEMSIRLALRGCKIKYASDVQSCQESSAKVTQLISQRMRWFRGNMEEGLKYGKLITKLNRRNVDIELALTAPFIFLLCFLGFIIAFYGFMVPVQPDPISGVISQFASLLTIIVLLTTAIALVYSTNQPKITNLLWLPLIYAYWFAETFMATFAFIQIVLRRPRKWTKTKKTGVVTNSPCQDYA